MIGMLLRTWDFAWWVFHRRGNMQACTECYGGPLVVSDLDPQGLMCSMCLHQYLSNELLDVFDLKVSLRSRVGTADRRCLNDLLGRKSESDTDRAGWMQMAVMFSDRQRVQQALVIVEIANAMPGVTAKFRARRGWSYFGPFVNSSSDDNSSRWRKSAGFTLSCIQRLYVAWKLVEEITERLPIANGSQRKNEALRG